jgi:hypothetical protein
MFGVPLNLDGYPNLKDFMGIIYLKHAPFQLFSTFFKKTCTWRYFLLDNRKMNDIIISMPTQ